MILSLIPWWVWAAVVAVLIILALLYAPWVVLLWQRLPAKVRWVLVLIGTLGLAFIAGRNRGAHDVQQQQAEANAKANERRKDIDREIDTVRDADLDKRLDRWMRPND